MIFQCFETVAHILTEHILRLLATHHIVRECAPNIFTMNRISSLLDSGKPVAKLRQWESEGRSVPRFIFCPVTSLASCLNRLRIPYLFYVLKR